MKTQEKREGSGLSKSIHVSGKVPLIYDIMIY